MTLDHALGLLFVFAMLFRYHRSELEKAEARFEKCDKERVLLHNVFYQNAGADVTNGGAAPEQLIEREPETPDSLMKERIRQTKLLLKSKARTNPSELGRMVRNVVQRAQPRFSRIRPSLDPGTQKVAADQASQMFAEVRQQVNNGRNPDSGG